MEPRYVLAEKDLFTRSDSYYKSGINSCLEYVDTPSRATAFSFEKAAALSRQLRQFGYRFRVVLLED